MCIRDRAARCAVPWELGEGGVSVIQGSSIPSEDLGEAAFKDELKKEGLGPAAIAQAWHALQEEHTAGVAEAHGLGVPLEPGFQRGDLVELRVEGATIKAQVTAPPTLKHGDYHLIVQLFRHHEDLSGKARRVQAVAKVEYTMEDFATVVQCVQEHAVMQRCEDACPTFRFRKRSFDEMLFY
eukprot:TRINITY_DN51677_c0_g1_i1.p2 TRINITY_DN51677_c0_g1~~TRINITY_DN51677_c0_g1_i1.p2  ORF type:complete len:182 (+),score=57.40 TRINITY_DN51677_c0_g1_i1:96-641(+)